MRFLFALGIASLLLTSACAGKQKKEEAPAPAPVEAPAETPAPGPVSPL